MAVIVFSENHSGWVKAGWVVRQILDDVIPQYPDDSAMASEFDYAKQSSGICVFALNRGLEARVTSAIRHTAAGILSATIRSGIHDKPYGDARTVEQYREALRELLELIPPSKPD